MLVFKFLKYRKSIIIMLKQKKIYFTLKLWKRKLYFLVFSSVFLIFYFLISKKQTFIIESKINKCVLKKYYVVSFNCPSNVRFKVSKFENNLTNSRIHHHQSIEWWIYSNASAYFDISIFWQFGNCDSTHTTISIDNTYMVK